MDPDTHNILTWIGPGPIDPGEAASVHYIDTYEGQASILIMAIREQEEAIRII